MDTPPPGGDSVVALDPSPDDVPAADPSLDTSPNDVSALEPSLSTTRPVGSPPLADEEAAARVILTGFERRPSNAAANSYWPSDAELELFRTGWRDQYGRTPVDYFPAYALVTGRFTGTTDEIISWAARKWGIDEDVLRAVAAVESWWNQGAAGDQEGGMTPEEMAAYPVFSHVDGDSVRTSVGLTQLKW